MFESVRWNDAAARLRAAAAPPLAAWAAAQLFLDFVGMLPPISRFWFHLLDLLLVAGAVIGAVALIRVVVSSARELRGRTWIWLALAVAAESLCAQLAIARLWPR